MTDILGKLDETMLGLFPNDGIQFNGLCDLLKKQDQVHPVTIDDRKQVSINDRWDVIHYHRLEGASFASGELQQFGRSTGRQLTQNIRTIVCAKAKKGEDWIYTFVQSIPESLTLTNYEFIDINDINIIIDQEATYIAEFGNNSYEKHIQTWNIYALEYGVEFLKCL